jgi:hypothetical protein
MSAADPDQFLSPDLTFKTAMLWFQIGKPNPPMEVITEYEEINTDTF